MKNVILIRFGEIFLKGKNRGFFEKVLYINIRESLNRFNLKVQKIPGRYLISDYDKEYEEEIIDRLTKIAGIFSFSSNIN